MATSQSITPTTQDLHSIAARLGRRINGNGVIRLPCPVHHGNKRSAAIGETKGRLWAKCHSHYCPSDEILAAVGVRKQEPFNPGPLPAPVAGLEDFHPNIPKEGVGLDEYLAMLKLGPTIRSNYSGVRYKADLNREPPPRPPQADFLPSLAFADAVDYLARMDTAKGARVAYQHSDGRTGHHTRSAGKQTRNPGITGEDWQVRRWNPVDVADAPAIVMAEGEKDAATFAQRGYIAFSAPGGAGRLATADYTELIQLHRDTGLDVVLAFDNDEAGHKAERHVDWLLGDERIRPLKLSRFGPPKGSIADYTPDEMDSLIAEGLHPTDTQWSQPRRTTDYECRKPRITSHTSNNGKPVYKGLPCGKCALCESWDALLHVERCARGRPALVLVFDNIGAADDSTDGCILDCEAFRSKWLDGLRRSAFPLAPGDRNGKTSYMTIVTRNPETYRGRLVVFLADSDPDRIAFNPERIEWEQRKLEGTGITVRGIPYPSWDIIEGLAPPTLTYKIDPETLTRKGKQEHKGHVNAWTSGGGWPNWVTLPSLYDLDDGQEVEAPPEQAMPVKHYRKTFGFSWNPKQTAFTNQVNREEYAYRAAHDWMRGVYLSIEDLDAIDKAEESGNAKEVIADIPGYRGPSALLRDAAAYHFGRNNSKWRKAFMPVLAMIGGAV